MKSRYKRIQIDGKSISEHRYVAEQTIGRKLLPTEQVHHINGDRFDNRPENLQVVTQAEHDRIHKWKYPETATCVICGRVFTPSPSKRKTAKVCSTECKHKLDVMNARKREKPIAQFTMDGVLIKTWRSARDIQDHTGYYESNISKCCSHQIKSCYGYKWEHMEG